MWDICETFGCISNRARGGNFELDEKKKDVRRIQGKKKESQGNSNFDRDEKIGVDSRGEEEKKKWRTSKRG